MALVFIEINISYVAINFIFKMMLENLFFFLDINIWIFGIEPFDLEILEKHIRIEYSFIYYFDM